MQTDKAIHLKELRAAQREFTKRGDFITCAGGPVWFASGAPPDLSRDPRALERAANEDRSRRRTGTQEPRMIITGVAATPHTPIGGCILLAHAVDTAQRGIPLCLEHGREIGEVLHLQYIGNDLHIEAETGDFDAQQPGFFSVCGKPLVREQHGDVWHVSKFRLDEVSLVRVPQNEKCIVIERKPSDPMRRFIKTRSHQFDLLIRGVQCASRALEVLQQLHQQELRGTKS